MQNRQTLKDGEYPFYAEDSSLSKVTEKIPQGPGSGLDADTIQGLQAVTARVKGPNKLVATGKDGLLPISIIPTTLIIGGGVVTNRAGTQTYRIFIEDDQSVSYDPV